MSLADALASLVASEPFERLLLARDRPISAHAEVGEGFAIAGVATGLDTAVLVVAAGPREAEEVATAIEVFLGSERVALLPAWEALPYEGISPSPEVAARRANAVQRLREAKGPFALVAPALAAMHGMIPTLGTVPPVELVAGRDLPPDELAERLVDLGYSRADVVEHRGEFAVRGGVVDVFPGTARRPVRCEYLGDEIESMREFSTSTQLSTAPVAHVEVPPVRELIADDDLRDRAGRRASLHGDRLADGLQRLADGLHVEGAEMLAPLLFDDLPTPADLLPSGGWVVLAQASRTLDRARQALTEADALAQATAWPGPPALVDLEQALGDRVQLHLSEFTEGLDLEVRPWGTAQGNPAELAKRLRELADRGYRTIVTGRGHGSLDRAKEVLGGGIDRMELVEASLANGFVFAPGSSRSPPRRTCSVPAATRGRRPDSRAGERTRSRRSSSRGTSRCTASTAWAAMAGSPTGRSRARSATTSFWSTRRGIGCSCRATRWGWWRGTSAVTRRGCTDSAARTGRAPHRV